MSVDKSIADLVARLEAVTKRLESVEGKIGSGGGHSAAPSGPASAFVEEYQQLIDQFIKPYVELSGKLGDAAIKEQADAVLKAVDAQKAFLEVASKSKKPADSALQDLIKPTSEAMAQISAIKEKNRASKFINNLSTISEGIGALGWVLVSPAPGPMVKEMQGSAEFYGNRILKDFKGKDQQQCDWVAAYVNFLKELQVYIKKYHTTGVSWNPQGGEASAAKPSAAPTPASTSAPASTPAPATGGNPAAKQGLFAALNQGGAVTSGLKKVTDDMKTKNRTDKTSVVPAGNTPAPAASTSAGGAKKPAVTKPPRVELEGNKWVVEYQTPGSNVVIDQTEIKNTVYVYRCKGATIQIKGKVNSISVDDCDKTGVVFENIVSGVEVVNCRGIQIQSLGKIPNITIDKTHGIQIYLSKDSLDVEIITSTSSELNVTIPQKGDETTETPIPEQFKSTVKNGKLVTEHVVHKG